MMRVPAFLLALLALLWAPLAAAEVVVSFHSYNGSLFGRYPHAFVVLEGTLDATGERVEENYGFTAKKVSPAILRRPVEHAILIEEPDYIRKTNRHFSVTVDDATYRRIVREMESWRDAPGRYYDLDERNCIHFVGTIARMAGLRVEYPRKMLRRPKKWLNHIAQLNPVLGADRID